MHRLSLINLLYNYSPTDLHEQLFKKQIITFIEQHPTCFERSLEIGHITASAWLLNTEKTHALLTHHAKLNQWFQVGGHCDGNPDVLAVAIKEAQEESGIEDIIPVSSDIFDIDIHLIPENSREKAHYHYDIRFLLQTIHTNEFKQSNESKALQWISKKASQLPSNTSSIVRMFNKWINQ